MNLATKWQEIEDNLIQLDRYRNSSIREEVNFYLDLIRQGKCFVIYRSSTQLFCGPSRFVGYASNDLHSHLANKKKDGRITNGAIETIFGHEAAEDKVAEIEYKKFCANLGIKPSSVKRKYWFRTASKS